MGSIAAIGEDDEPPEWVRGERLGSGRFGTVFKCLNALTGALFAIKHVALGDTTKKERVDSVLHEVSVMSALDHPNIIRYYGADVRENQLCIILEYVSGGTLEKRIAEFGPLNDTVVRVYTKQLLQGLRYLHEQGVVHRDIKPANVLVDVNGVVKLADFGCSELLSAVKCGVLLGTPPYMAPEIVQRRQCGAAADVWALGCTVMEMRTGKGVWPPGHAVETIIYTMRRGGSPPIPDDLSNPVKQFVLSCLVPDPAMRPLPAQLLEHAFILPFRTTPKTNATTSTVSEVIGISPTPGTTTTAATATTRAAAISHHACAAAAAASVESALLLADAAMGHDQRNQHDLLPHSPMLGKRGFDDAITPPPTPSPGASPALLQHERSSKLSRASSSSCVSSGYTSGNTSSVGTPETVANNQGRRRLVSRSASKSSLTSSPQSFSHNNHHNNNMSSILAVAAAAAAAAVGTARGGGGGGGNHSVDDGMIDEDEEIEENEVAAAAAAAAAKASARYVPPYVLWYSCGHFEPLQADLTVVEEASRVGHLHEDGTATGRLICFGPFKACAQYAHELPTGSSSAVMCVRNLFATSATHLQHQSSVAARHLADIRNALLGTGNHANNAVAAAVFGGKRHHRAASLGDVVNPLEIAAARYHHHTPSSSSSSSSSLASSPEPLLLGAAAAVGGGGGGVSLHHAPASGEMVYGAHSMRFSVLEPYQRAFGLYRPTQASVVAIAQRLLARDVSQGGVSLKQQLHLVGDSGRHRHLRMFESFTSQMLAWTQGNGAGAFVVLVGGLALWRSKVNAERDNSAARAKACTAKAHLSAQTRVTVPARAALKRPNLMSVFSKMAQRHLRRLFR